MNSNKYSFLQAVLGEDGARALRKAMERSSELEAAVLPRAIVAWLEGPFSSSHEGVVPGCENQLVFSKSESGFTGSIGIGDEVYAFENASTTHLAAAIAVSLGLEYEKVPSTVRSIDLAKLGKSLDLLVKAREVNRMKGGQWIVTPETIAQQHSGGWKDRYPTVEIRQVPFHQLDWLDFRRKPDMRGLGIKHIQDLVTKMKDGTPLPPAIGYEYNAGGRSLVVAHDGNHRIAAAKILGHRTVPVLVFTKQLSLPLGKEERGVEPKYCTACKDPLDKDGHCKVKAHWAQLDKSTKKDTGRRAAGAIIRARDTGKILLLLRSGRVLDPNYWGVPGGQIEAGATERSTLHTEAKEELGGVPDGFRVLPNPPHVFRSANFRYHTHLAEVPNEFEPTLNWEHVRHAWVDPQAVIGDKLSPEMRLHPNLKAAVVHHFGESLGKATKKDTLGRWRDDRGQADYMELGRALGVTFCAKKGCRSPIQPDGKCIRNGHQNPKPSNLQLDKAKGHEPQGQHAAPLAPIPPEPPAGPLTGQVKPNKTVAVKPTTTAQGRPKMSKSIKITKAQATRKCPICGVAQFGGSVFTGCMCFNSLAKSVKVNAGADGKLELVFGADWDRDSILTLIESFGGA